MILETIFALSVIAFWLLRGIFRTLIQWKGYKWFYNKVYLRTPHWRFVRWLKYGIAGRKCEICGTPMNLTLHHKTYKHKWWEFVFLNDLQVLCWTDHQREQEKMNAGLFGRRGGTNG